MLYVYNNKIAVLGAIPGNTRVTLGFILRNLSDRMGGGGPYTGDQTQVRTWSSACRANVLPL